MSHWGWKDMEAGSWLIQCLTLIGGVGSFRQLWGQTERSLSRWSLPDVMWQKKWSMCEGSVINLERESRGMYRTKGKGKRVTCVCHVWVDGCVYMSVADSCVHAQTLRLFIWTGRTTAQNPKSWMFLGTCVKIGWPVGYHLAQTQKRQHGLHWWY